MKKTNKNKKRSSQNNFDRLSIFQPQKYKFKRKCPLSGKGAPVVDYKNIRLLRKYITENGKKSKKSKIGRASCRERV